MIGLFESGTYARPQMYHGVSPLITWFVAFSGGWAGTRHWKSTKEVPKPDIWVSEWELTDGDAARETAVGELIALLPETIEEIT